MACPPGVLHSFSLSGDALNRFSVYFLILLLMHNCLRTSRAMESPECIAIRKSCHFQYFVADYSEPWLGLDKGLA